MTVGQCKAPLFNTYACYTYTILNLQIITKKNECNINAYVLTLTLNQSKNYISGIQEILLSAVNGHVIDDLNPGYRYNITMTAKTSKGPLKSSPSYSFVPFMPGKH